MNKYDVRKIIIAIIAFIGLLVAADIFGVIGGSEFHDPSLFPYVSEPN